MRRRSMTRVALSACVAAVTIATAPLTAVAQAQPPQHRHDESALQQRAAESAAYSPELLAQLDAVRAATERFRDHRVAVREGYRKVAGDGPLMGEHWVRADLVDAPFDIARPSTLQYLMIDDEHVLTGVAYTVYRAADDPLPDGFVGEHDVWHVHDMLKIAMVTTEDRPLLRWITERRIAHGRTQWDRDRPELTMVHAWVWEDNPDGVFAQDHRLIPYLRAGLPREWGIEASADAAHGVALLHAGTCEQELRRTAFLTGATWRQRQDLSAACSVAERSVQRARAAYRGSETDPTPLNAAAEQAWRDYLQRRAEVLTDEQVARLAIAVEHPDGHREETRR